MTSSITFSEDYADPKSEVRAHEEAPAWAKFDKIWPKGWYRNMWYVTNDDHGSYFAVGVNGQNLWINPKTRVVIVKFSSTPVALVPKLCLGMRFAKLCFANDGRRSIQDRVPKRSLGTRRTSWRGWGPAWSRSTRRHCR